MWWIIFAILLVMVIFILGCITIVLGIPYAFFVHTMRSIEYKRKLAQWKRERRKVHRRLVELRDQLEPSVQSLVEEKCAQYGLQPTSFRRYEDEDPERDRELDSFVGWRIALTNANPGIECWISIQDSLVYNGLDIDKMLATSGRSEFQFQAGSSTYVPNGLNIPGRSLSLAELARLLDEILGSYEIYEQHDQKFIRVKKS